MRAPRGGGLRGRPVGAADYVLLRRLHGDSRAAATLSAAGVVAPSRTRSLIARARRARHRPGLGLWLFHDGGGRFVGYCGLLPVRLAGRPAEIELLYAVMPRFWRRGHAGAMAAAVLRRADAAGLGAVVAFTLPHNHASRRVMAGQGFAPLGDIVHAGLRHVLYRRAGGYGRGS